MHVASSVVSRSVLSSSSQDNGRNSYLFRQVMPVLVIVLVPMFTAATASMALTFVVPICSCSFLVALAFAVTSVHKPTRFRTLHKPVASGLNQHLTRNGPGPSSNRSNQFLAIMAAGAE